MLRERILPQSEVIRAIFLEYSPCCGGSRTVRVVAVLPEHTADLGLGQHQEVRRRPLGAPVQPADHDQRVVRGQAPAGLFEPGGSVRCY